MSLKTRFGNLGNILDFDTLTKENIFVLNSPILSNSQFNKFKNFFDKNSCMIDCTFKNNDNLSKSIERIQRDDFPGSKNWDLSKNILYNEIISSDLILYPPGNDIWDTENSYNIDLSTPGTIKRGSSANAYWEEWAISKNYFNSNYTL